MTGGMIMNKNIAVFRWMPACLLPVLLLCMTAMAGVPDEWIAVRDRMFNDTTPVMAVVVPDGVEIDMTGSHVAAFLGDEIRGSATFYRRTIPDKTTGGMTVL